MPLRIRVAEPDYAGTMAEAAGVRPTAYDELLNQDAQGHGEQPKPEPTHTGGW